MLPLRAQNTEAAWCGNIRLTHRGQRQTKVCGLVFHLYFYLVEESLDLFLLKSIPVTTNSRKMLIPVQLIYVWRL